MRIKNKLTDEKEVFLQTQQKKKAVKLSLPPSNPQLLAKILHLKKKLHFQGWKNAGALHH